MPSLRIVLEGDNAFPEFKGRETIDVHHFAVTALEGGMTSGNPSIAFLIELPDGRVVFAQSSLLLFLAAASAFKAKYGDPNQEPKGVPI